MGGVRGADDRIGGREKVGGVINSDQFAVLNWVCFPDTLCTMIDFMS